MGGLVVYTREEENSQVPRSRPGHLQEVSPEVLEFLASLREKVTIGFVGGSDLKKQKEQLGDGVLGMFDYCFRFVLRGCHTCFEH